MEYLNSVNQSKYFTDYMFNLLPLQYVYVQKKLPIGFFLFHLQIFLVFYNIF